MVMARHRLWLLICSLLMLPAGAWSPEGWSPRAWAQSRMKSIAPAAEAVTSGWDVALPGKWTYRSYLNRADVIVFDDPEPAVQNLAAIFGQGSTANNAAKALGLVFGE